MKWTNLVGAAGLLILVSAVRLQDKFMYTNKTEREAEVTAAEKK